MPYANRKQAVAIFLNIKRRQGQKAAEAFGRKHRADFKVESRNSGYKSRRRRS